MSTLPSPLMSANCAPVSCELETKFTGGAHMVEETHVVALALSHACLLPSYPFTKSGKPSKFTSSNLPPASLPVDNTKSSGGTKYATSAQYVLLLSHVLWLPPFLACIKS